MRKDPEDDRFYVHSSTLRAYAITNTGWHDVTVPSGLTPGEYFVKVRSSTNAAANAISDAVIVDDVRRDRCVTIGVLLLGLPQPIKLPYPLLRRIAILSGAAP